MQRIVQISIPLHNGLFDITREVEAIVTESEIKSGMANVYAQGATATIMKEFKMMKAIGTMIENSRYQAGFEHYIYFC
ncbi:MAG: YjbQ family protein [Bacteroidales bacterium]|nr:YjbQ family protein [Bacteroidales bacterium]